MKSEILHLLRNADGYISGQQLCEAFGVSRTAVWKAINQLKRGRLCYRFCAEQRLQNYRIS